MIKFIVIEEGSGDYFIVDNLEKLIKEMYGEYDDERGRESFDRIYRVIEIEGEFSLKEY